MRNGWYFIDDPKESHLIFWFANDLLVKFANLGRAPQPGYKWFIPLTEYDPNYLEGSEVAKYEGEWYPLVDELLGTELSIKEAIIVVENINKSQIEDAGELFLSKGEVIAVIKNLISFSKGVGAFSQADAVLLIELLTLINSKDSPDEVDYILTNSIGLK
jgi:hypothetical protein